MGQSQNMFFGVVLSLVSIIIGKIANPSAVNFRRGTWSVLAKGEIKRFEPEHFATAILARNKEVFERLAEM